MLTNRLVISEACSTSRVDLDGSIWTGRLGRVDLDGSIWKGRFGRVELDFGDQACELRTSIVPASPFSPLLHFHRHHSDVLQLERLVVHLLLLLP